MAYGKASYTEAVLHVVRSQKLWSETTYVSGNDQCVSRRSLLDLTDREVLALAIQSEEEDGRLYRELADGLKDSYPASAKVFMDIAEEESRHRRALLDLFQQRFGAHIPLVRREDVRTPDVSPNPAART